MSSKKKQEQIRIEEFEEKEGGSKAGRIFISVLLYAFMLLLLYIIFAVPEAGTSMEALRNVLRGLAGSFTLLLPVAVGWCATLCAMAAAGRKIAVWKCVLDSLLFVCALTIAQLTVTETIISTRMTYPGFANFVTRSYQYGRGGGAIGAILAWPLYINIGKGGGILASLLMALLLLTASGRSIVFGKWAVKQISVRRRIAAQRRRMRINEQMFEDFDDEPAPEYHDGGASPLDQQPAKPARRKKSTDSWRDDEFAVDIDLGDPALKKNAQRRREAGRKDGKSPADKRSENIFEDSILSDETRIYPKSFKAAQGKKKTTAEKMEEREVTTMKKEGLKMDKHSAKYREETADTLDDELFGISDDFDSVRTDAEKGGKKAAPARAEAGKSAAAKKEKSRVTAEDLIIEPEKCDVLEGDDVSGETPKKKKAMPKLKRTPRPDVSAEEEEYNYPPIDLLEISDEVKENHRERDMEKAKLLEDTLKQFGISSTLTGIAHGPAVTRFELQPAAGIKVSRITSLADDIAMHLAAMSVRIEAPIPGKAAVGVEIPNEKVEMVRLRDVLESAEARKSVSKIAVCLGKDNSGRYIVADIAKMPHVLIAGQTGSGKSVCINSIITSILFRATPDEVKLILIDPKMVELSIYNDIPHLICPVVTDCKKAASALEWAVMEMTNRYKRFAERGVRDIKGYNKALQEGEKPMPQMVIIIDELADLMMVAPGEVEDSICRLAQLARAAGMHLVIATQRPSVNVITGIIKANIPTRIAFSVASQVDSRTMIDHGGAEKLLGNGDMLFVPSGINKPMRVQGAWVSDEEVHAIVSYIKERSEASYDPDMIEKMENAVRTDAEKEEFASEYDPRLPEAVEIVVEAGQASVSMLQRRMRVGYARAGRLIDEMEQRGIVSEADGAKPRTVLITREGMADLFED